MSADGLVPRRRGSHPPSLRVLVRRAMRDHALASPSDRILVACSGGPDSMALLHTLALLRQELGVSLVAHGVDHGLRPEAADELALAADLAARLDVPFGITRVYVEAGGNLQARARTVRHEALRAAASASGSAHIATGHTANDRAETLLMRMVRGTGPKGLAVLPPRNGPLIRPLFAARREDVVRHLDRHHLASAADPSNASKRFLRSRVRHEVLPLLAELSPKIVEALCALADAAGEIEADPLAVLGRAQRAELGRAIRSGEPARLLLADGIELEVGRPGPAKRRPCAVEEGSRAPKTLRSAAKLRS